MKAPAIVRSIAFAVSLAAVLASNVAQAVTFEWHNLSLSTKSEYFTPAPGPFLDRINFTLSDPSNFSGSTQIINLSKPSYTTFIGSVTTNLYKSDGTTLVAGFGTSPSFSVSNLAAGDYSIKYSGTATGPQGGLYSVSLTASPVSIPVPEPGTYAMFLAGLGLIGAIATSRKNRLSK